MKRLLSTLVILCLLLAGTACAESRHNVNYADRGNWAFFAEGEGKVADVFLICPTVDMNDEYNMSMEDEATKANFLGALNMERGIYEGSARLYAPYYRQAAMKVYGLASDMAFEAKELYGDSVKDIASDLGVSEPRVYQLINRAKAIGKQYRKDYDNE